jgi:hypothetical protein
MEENRLFLSLTVVWVTNLIVRRGGKEIMSDHL